MQNYTEGDILLILKILQSRNTGRKKLSEFLSLGEATIRTLFRRLESENLISSTRQGQKITQKGEQFLRDFPSFTLPKPVTVEGLTLSTHNVGTLVRKFSSHVKNGMHFRDAAIIAGASGATTLITSQGTLIFPDETPLQTESVAALLKEFSPQEKDIIIIATAETEKKALRGISGCLSLLFQKENKEL